MRGELGDANATLARLRAEVAAADGDTRRAASAAAAEELGDEALRSVHAVVVERLGEAAAEQRRSAAGRFGELLTTVKDPRCRHVGEWDRVRGVPSHPDFGAVESDERRRI